MKKDNDMDKKSVAKKSEKVKRNINNKDITPVVKTNSDSIIINWINENKISLIFGVVGLVIGILVMFILWPERIAKLKDGSEVIVKTKTMKVTADDLFNKLKGVSGLDALLEIIDESILNEKYDLEKEAEEYAKEQTEYYYNIYENQYGIDKETFLSENNFKNEQEFTDYFKLEFLYQTYYDEYLSSQVTESNAKKYYKDEVFGTKTVYVFSSEKNSKNLEKVRKELKKGTSVSKLKDKYSDVKMIELGEIDFKSLNGFSETFKKNVKSLNEKEYSAVYEDTSYKYAVIYISKTKDKPSYEDAEKDIRSILGSELGQKDSTLYYKAFIELRKNAGIDFSDTSLKKEYDAWVTKYSKKSTETE